MMDDHDESTETNGLDVASSFVRVACHTCGIHFFLPAEYYAARMNDHTIFYCPSKHKIMIAMTQAQMTIEVARREIARLTASNDQITTENRQLKDRMAIIDGNNMKDPTKDK